MLKMLERGTPVHVNDEKGEWTVAEAWNLDILKQVLYHADYGYEVHSNKGAVLVVTDKDVEEIQ